MHVLDIFLLINCGSTGHYVTDIRVDLNKVL